MNNENDVNIFGQPFINVDNRRFNLNEIGRQIEERRRNDPYFARMGLRQQVRILFASVYGVGFVSSIAMSYIISEIQSLFSRKRTEAEHRTPHQHIEKKDRPSLSPKSEKEIKRTIEFDPDNEGNVVLGRIV